MQKKNLQKLLSKLEQTDLPGFQAFDEAAAKLKLDLQQSVKASTLEDVNSKLASFQSRLDFTPLTLAFDQLKQELEDRDGKQDAETRSQVEARLAELQKTLDARDTTNQDEIDTLVNTINNLQKQIQIIDSKPAPVFPDFTPQIEETKARLAEISTRTDLTDNKAEEVKGVTSKLEEELKKFRADIASRFANLGGGAMNRQILVGGADPLTRYTDINLKAGSNVTITYTNNDVTQKADITISSSGGGGSVAGTIRSINRVSASQTIGSVTGTDYVYIATAGVKLTLPDATGLTNLYTIKNVSTSSVLVDTTSAQTIDTSSNLILPIQFTSVDIVNDGANNWSIT